MSIVFLRLFRIEMYLSRYFWLFHEGFVVAQSLRKGSHIPMDMILKKKHNNLAKRPSWIIDVSRKKEAVCKRNLIRHDKLPYTSNLEFLWSHIAGDEYNLDHKFFPSAKKTDKIAVDTLFEYFKATIILLMTKLQIWWLVSLLILTLKKTWYTLLQWVKGCTVSLNHHNLIKRLLRCLTQSQKQNF